MAETNLIFPRTYWTVPYATAMASFTNFLIDASTDKDGKIVQAWNGEAITHIGFRQGTATGTQPTFKCGLQGVDSSGLPDGTYLGGGSPASATFVPSSANNSKWVWVSLTNSYTPTPGDLIAIVIEYDSGTIGASNSCSFANTVANLGGTCRLPYALQNTGSWAKQAAMPCWGLRTANARYGHGIQSANYSTNTAGTNGHRSALEFNLRAAEGDTYTVFGFTCLARIPATANSFIAGLWSAGGVMTSITLAADKMQTQNSDGMFQVVFISPQTLSFGTTYWAGFEVTGGAAVGLRGAVLEDEADRLAYGNQRQMRLATFDGSTWTGNSLVRPLLDLDIHDWTKPAGGGGGGPLINVCKLAM